MSDMWSNCFFVLVASRLPVFQKLHVFKLYVYKVFMFILHRNRYTYLKVAS